MSDNKLFAFVIFMMMASIFVPIFISEYNKGKCRIEAIKAQLNADDIVKICK